MDHTHIVQANDLERFAFTKKSEAIIPELLYWLVKQSITNASVCRIPYGDAINQPGWDGIVRAESAFLEFVPDGTSYWEVGTGSNPQEKATDEFKKRTERMSNKDRANASFVFVTPRYREWGEPKQTKWIENRKNQGWRHIRIIDGVKLADWLREFPAVGQWMAKKIGLAETLGGIATPTDHWEIIRTPTEPSDPPLPSRLFTEGREDACIALHELFEGNPSKLSLIAESPTDVADFVAAYFEILENETTLSFAYRCLFVADEDAWRSVVELEKSHVFVADPRLGLEDPERADLQTLAVRGGHSVVVPLMDAWSGEGPKVLQLRSPSQSQIQNILRESGFSEVRSQELARVGGDRVSALRRHLQGPGLVPQYARRESAVQIAQAGLAGKWNGKNTADRAAMKILLGKDYGKWIERLRPECLRSDSPVIQFDEKWRFVAREEAWGALGNRITDEDLVRLQRTAIIVLGERDPQFDLPKEERYAAGIYDKRLKHSRFLREGLAETLALVGSRSKALSSCSIGQAENVAGKLVSGLLDNTNWERWASLDSLLPLLAEASPERFLDAVQSALQDLDKSPYRELFAQEFSGGLGGRTYASGLLWALETLAWKPDFLIRVVVILAELATIDPGGNWTNRPINSLIAILLPWRAQTCASPDMRLAAVKTTLNEQPQIGWELILGLLPRSHESSSGCRRPTWRNFIPSDWNDGVLPVGYSEQVNNYARLAVGLAKKSTDKLTELINRLPELPNFARKSLLGHLSSESVMELPKTERIVIWERLKGVASQHRKHPDANWAMSEKAVAEIDTVVKRLTPESTELEFKHLFSDRDYDLMDGEGDFEEQQRRLAKVRADAMDTILETGGTLAALAFARSVASPFEVGSALVGIENEKIERDFLPSLLNSEDEADTQFLSGFIRGKFRKMGWMWVDRILGDEWTDKQKSVFLALLPFEGGVWIRVKDQLGVENEGLYWRSVTVNPFSQYKDPTFAIEKLIEFDRAPDAIECIFFTIGDDHIFNENLAIRALLAVKDTSSDSRRLVPQHTSEVIERLQKSCAVDSDVLFEIEWKYLQLLDEFSAGSPVTLEKRLATAPVFFAELIALVYRSDKEHDNGVEPGEQAKKLADHAYSLLNVWKTCPGTLPDGTFDSDAFQSWYEEVTDITKDSGHSEVAQMEMGNVLTFAPPDPCGLWIHTAAATALNGRNAEKMRSGFTSKLINRRGAYWGTGGKGERELAEKYNQHAVDLDLNGYPRFGAEMRDLAKFYERRAEHESNRDRIEG